MPVAKRRSATPKDDGARTEDGGGESGWETAPYVWYEGNVLRGQFLDAQWKGHICVHQEDGLWAVCTRRGVCVSHVRTREDARAVAEIVLAAFTAAQLKTLPHDDLKAVCPKWFIAWGKAVHRVQKFVDPTPYLDGAYV